MKKTIITLLAAACMAFVGCDREPTPAQMEATADAVGRAAGYVANQTKIDEKSRAVTIEIMTKAADVTPTNNQSFAEAWTPIAKETTDKLVAEGKLDAGQAVLVLCSFDVACKGLDYLVTVRYPKVKKYENLMSAAVKGFTGGFLEVFKPANAKLMSAEKDTKYDKEAYEYLLKAAKTK